MFDAIARVLAFFYSLPVVGGSVGYAIMLLTAAVMMVLTPLTLRATKSTIAMQEVQPKLKELQKKHKDDRQTLNQEMMKLYSEHGINPVGGCLPMVAQLPVFLVLFNVLRGLSRRVSETQFYALSEEARARVGGGPVAGDHFAPRYLSSDSELYQDLNGATEIGFGPFDLAVEFRNIVQSDFLGAIPYVFLILFVVGTSYYQQWQVSNRRTTGAPMNPQQEMILRVLPLASGISGIFFPAGLVLYWATSNVFRIGQQYYITRRFYGDRDDSVQDGGANGSSADNGSSGGKKSSEVDDDVVDSNETGSKSSSNNGGSKKGGSSKGGSGKGSSGKGSSGKGSSGNGSSPAAPKNASDSESASAGSNGERPARGDAESRSAAWERRRQQKAKTQAAVKHRKEQSSRVTPKGTKPTSSNKKRKR